MPEKRRVSPSPAPAPRTLTDLEYVAMRLHEAAIKRDGLDALNMETATASVGAARTLLDEARH